MYILYIYIHIIYVFSFNFLIFMWDILKKAYKVGIYMYIPTSDLK